MMFLWELKTRQQELEFEEKCRTLRRAAGKSLNTVGCDRETCPGCPFHGCEGGLKSGPNTKKSTAPHRL